MDEKQVVKLVGGPAHGRKLVMSNVNMIIKVPELPETPRRGDIKDCPIIVHEYHWTNVEYKGVRCYRHSKLDAVKSKMLMKAYVNANYEKYLNELRG